MIIEKILLDSDLCVTLLDQTSHYFGGYYHVKILAYCDVLLKSDYFKDDFEFNTAVGLLGSSVRFERILEKMAVPEPEIESVRNILTQTFHETTKPYLLIPEFAGRFISNEYKKSVNKSSKRNSLRV